MKPWIALTALIIAAGITLTGCIGGGGSAQGTATTTTTTTSTATPAALYLNASTTTIKNDGTETADIIATVVDSKGGVISGLSASFSVTGAILSASSGTTDTSGKATVTLSVAGGDYSNRQATVTASVGSLTKTLDISISGSALSITPSSTAVASAASITLTATTSVGSSTKANQKVRFAIASGGGSLSTTSSIVTGNSGTTAAVTYSAPTVAASTPAVIRADWYDPTDTTVLVSQTTTITVNVPGISFDVVTPTATSVGKEIGDEQEFRVSVPDSITTTSGTSTVASVRFSATDGTWSAATGGAGATATLSVAHAAGQTPQSGFFQTPTTSNTVTLQADALDSSGKVLQTLYRTVNVSAKKEKAAAITVQPDMAVVPVSKTTTLRAKVRDASNNAVANVPVQFTLTATGGAAINGAFISPATATTDSAGQATATFTAGSAATDGGLTVTAAPITTGCPASGEPWCTAASGTTKVVVGTQSVNVVISMAGAVNLNGDSTMFTQKGSVLVVDANGNPVASTSVSVKVFPHSYREGTSTTSCYFTGTDGTGPMSSTTGSHLWIAGEDSNENGILDAGEDVANVSSVWTQTVSVTTTATGALTSQTRTVIPTPAGGASTTTAIDASAGTTTTTVIALTGLGDDGTGRLSPPQAAAGTLLSDASTDSAGIVTTKSDGVGTFTLTYPLTSAGFIRPKIRAVVVATGTEGSAELVHYLNVNATVASQNWCPTSDRTY